MADRAPHQEQRAYQRIEGDGVTEKQQRFIDNLRAKAILWSDPTDPDYLALAVFAVLLPPHAGDRREASAQIGALLEPDSEHPNNGPEKYRGGELWAECQDRADAYKDRKAESLSAWLALVAGASK